MRISDWSSDVFSSDLDAAWQDALKPAPKSEVQPEERKRIYLTPGERRVLAKLASFVEALTLLPLRPGALAALRVKDFDRRTGVLTIPKDKAGAGRIIPLSGSTRDRKSTRLNSSH